MVIYMLKAVRIYKINIRENILRQVIFTDKNIFLGLCFSVILIIWGLGPLWAQDVKVFFSLFSGGSILMVFSIRIDRQPLLSIF